MNSYARTSSARSTPTPGIADTNARAASGVGELSTQCVPGVGGGGATLCCCCCCYCSAAVAAFCCCSAALTEHEEPTGVEAQSLLHARPVARANRAERLRTVVVVRCTVVVACACTRLDRAADAAEEEAADGVVVGDLIEDAQRRAERRLDAPTASHLAHSAAEQRHRAAEACRWPATRRTVGSDDHRVDLWSASERPGPRLPGGDCSGGGV